MLAVAAILLLVAMSPVAPQTATSTTVAVMGDLGISMDAERNVDRAVLGGAQGLVGLGDYSYDGSIRGWHAMVSPLTSKGAWFARGNHDSIDTFKQYMPGQTSMWSTTINGVRVIAIDTDQRIDAGTAQYNWFVGELGREPASGGKIVIMHKPWWLGSGAIHPGHEFPGSGSTMDSLMTSHGVDMVYASHEHNYQRTSRNNIPYLIVGTGGRSIYPVAGSDPGTVATCACYGHALLTISPVSLQSRFIAVDGTQKDSVAVTLGGTSGFSASYSNVRGNSHWVETDVAANKPLLGVDMRINGGAWSSMQKQSYGSWAKGIAVPSGATVEFLAIATTGETSQSSSYAWPPGSTTTFTATFSPKAVGNDWWVEVDVSSSSTVTKVEASVNGGAFVALDKSEWGSWAKTINAPNGSQVKFRATNTAGATATSSTYTWT